MRVAGASARGRRSDRAAACRRARAEVWAYVDGQGMAHVAPQQVDSRYRRVLGDAPGGSGSEAVPGKTDRADGLLLWLEIAPEVRRSRRC